MKRVVVILDPAHGKDTPGKRSPDESHFEWSWSRMVCKDLEQELISRGYDVRYTSISENEIGLSKRKNNANEEKIQGNQIKFLLSLHNNAAANSGWSKATGVEIWTSKGKTLSDIFANELFKGIKKQFPEEENILRYRYGDESSKGYLGKEENFTVLMGNYYACLVEWLFMDNQEDLDKLKDDHMNRKFVLAMADGVDYIENYVNGNTGKVS